MVELRKYQDDAERALTEAILALLDKPDASDRLIVVKSPTGSGKTVIVGSAFKNAQQKTKRPFVVLWLSPGTGGLEDQSAFVLSELLASDPVSVRDLTVEYMSTNPAIPPGTVLVSNWEALVAQDKVTGEWTNRLTRDGEKRNLFELLESTRDAGTALVVVVDESHRNMSGDRAIALRKAIEAVCPFVLVEVSATPSRMTDRQKERKGTHFFVGVDIADVINEGMIKSKVLLQTGDEIRDIKTRFPDATADLIALRAAWERTADLTARYTEIESPVRPLLLVQVQDGPVGNLQKDVALDFLTDPEGAGLRADEIAVWLSKEKRNLDDIEAFSSPVRALVFKQAVAVGWDCPRAQVLLQFRNVKSKTFAIQTLGRILRMPELRHYDDEALNWAYVYTDLPDDQVRVNVIVEDEADAQILDTLVHRDDFRYTKGATFGLRLTSVFRPKRREFDYPMFGMKPHLTERLDTALGSLPTEWTEGSLATSMITDASFDTSEIEVGEDAEEGTLSVHGEREEVLQSAEQILAKFESLLVEDIRPYRSKSQSQSRIKTMAVEWFRRNRPSYSTDDIQNACLTNREAFVAAIHGACEAFAKSQEAEAAASARAKWKTNEEWEVPLAARTSSSDAKKVNDAFLMKPPLMDRLDSTSEEMFVEWLDKQVETGRIAWWWRNGTNAEDYLGVPYILEADDENEQSEEVGYPDFLVMATDGVLLVIEVKSEDDPTTGPRKATRAKARGLRDWASRMNELGARENCPRLEAFVAVPLRLSGGITVYRGNPDGWTEPTRQNLGTETGWQRI